MAEKEAQSRHDIQRSVLKNVTRKIRAASFVAILVIVAAVIFVYFENVISGTIIILVSLAMTLINRLFPRK